MSSIKINRLIDWLISLGGNLHQCTIITCCYERPTFKLCTHTSHDHGPWTQALLLTPVFTGRDHGWCFLTPWLLAVIKALLLTPMITGRNHGRQKASPVITGDAFWRPWSLNVIMASVYGAIVPISVPLQHFITAIMGDMFQINDNFSWFLLLNLCHPVSSCTQF